MRLWTRCLNRIFATVQQRIGWLPRCSGSRGVASTQPSGSSQPAASSARNSVSSTLLALIRSMPASASNRAPSSTATVPRMLGVPVMNLAMPSAGRYSGPISNWSRWENQPQIGWRSTSRSRAATYRNAGAPGPAFRYL